MLLAFSAKVENWVTDQGRDALGSYRFGTTNFLVSGQRSRNTMLLESLIELTVVVRSGSDKLTRMIVSSSMCGVSVTCRRRAWIFAWKLSTARLPCLVHKAGKVDVTAKVTS